MLRLTLRRIPDAFTTDNVKAAINAKAASASPCTCIHTHCLTFKTNYAGRVSHVLNEYKGYCRALFSYAKQIAIPDHLNRGALTRCEAR